MANERQLESAAMKYGLQRALSASHGRGRHRRAPPTANGSPLCTLCTLALVNPAAYRAFLCSRALFRLALFKCCATREILAADELFSLCRFRCERLKCPIRFSSAWENEFYRLASDNEFRNGRAEKSRKYESQASAAAAISFA